jgi:hypothetical protein
MAGKRDKAGARGKSFTPAEIKSIIVYLFYSLKGLLELSEENLSSGQDMWNTLAAEFNSAITAIADMRTGKSLSTKFKNLRKMSTADGIKAQSITLMIEEKHEVTVDSDPITSQLTDQEHMRMCSLSSLISL